MPKRFGLNHLLLMIIGFSFIIARPGDSRRSS